MTEMQILLQVFLEELMPDAIVAGWNKSGRGVCVDYSGDPSIPELAPVLRSAWETEMPGHDLVINTTQYDNAFVVIDACTVAV